MRQSHLGGVWTRGPVGRRLSGPPTPDAVREDWGWIGEGSELFLRAAPESTRLFTWDALALLIRGYARPLTNPEFMSRRVRAGCGALDLERVAEELRCHYLENGTLAVDDLEGSFTLALLDGEAGRVVLYRNLVGAGSTYYRADSDGLVFAGNLAELVEATQPSPRANRDVLPAFFLYRCVPGRDTLFADCHRLLPGEQVTWERGRVRREQRHSFADLAGTVTIEADAEAQVEHTLRAVLADALALRPGAANLLSGGVDSSYIQGVLNHVVPGPSNWDSQLPPSWSIAVDHPHTWMDTDYALTASRALGSRHTLVPADGPYASYLVDLLVSTGEPPNHVQSAYFGELARAMAAGGATAGLCGEGADSLFGLGTANHVHNARVMRRLLPLGLLRGLAGGACDLVGWDRLAATCRLASKLEDYADLEHPVNRVARFTDLDLALRCFGRGGVSAAMAERRALLELQRLPADPMDRLHGAGFLGEAVDSAGLWTTLFDRAGLDLLCPFLDSRVMRLALSLPADLRYPFRRPKELLKKALARHVPEAMARRGKLGFGQPIFEWLAPGGQLRPLVDGVGEYEFLDPAVLAAAKARGGWFLYNVVCYDLWHKLFIERSLPRVAAPAAVAKLAAAR